MYRTCMLLLRVRQRAHGFTLLELLVVVLIVGLLSGLVAPRYFSGIEKSKAGVTRGQMAMLEKALDQYRLDTGNYPEQGQGFAALQVRHANVHGWRGPYLKRDIPLDPWGHPYLYKVASDGNDINILSTGSDGHSGGDGDAQDIYLHASNS